MDKSDASLPVTGDVGLTSRRELVGVPPHYVLQEDEEIVNGLVFRWCHGGSMYYLGGELRTSCGHYVSTREPLDQTDKCDEFNGAEGYISWSMEMAPNWMSQERMLAIFATVIVLVQLGVILGQAIAAKLGASKTDTRIENRS